MTGRATAALCSHVQQKVKTNKCFTCKIPQKHKGKEGGSGVQLYGPCVIFSDEMLGKNSGKQNSNKTCVMVNFVKETVIDLANLKGVR